MLQPLSAAASLPLHMSSGSIPGHAKLLDCCYLHA